MTEQKSLPNSSVVFFERQFRQQVAAGDYVLNPFERAILPFLHGEVLDLGCGLGNLALAAARAGCRVTALDASPTAVADLRRRADAEGLFIETGEADLRRFTTRRSYDCVVSIGLLMFFPPAEARAMLAALGGWVRPGGVAAVNVLVEGTTYMDMFDPAGYCLFAEHEPEAAFPGWSREYASTDVFDAPGGTVKRFRTVVMRRPAAAGG